MSKFEISTVKCNSFEMDYIKFGSGEKTFVIIPGLSLRSILFSAGTIASAYSSFTDKYTVYVFDRKKEISEGYSIRNMATDTAEALKQLNIKNACILGTSQGGMISQYIAILYPDLVDKLVLGSTLSRQNETSRNVISTWVQYAQKGNVIKLNRSIFNYVYSEEYLEKYSRAFELIETDGNQKELDRFVILAKACLTFDAYNELESIKCPVLVIGDYNDKVVTGEASLEIAEKLNCQIYMYQDYSHAVYDEAPDYKEKILDFFK